MFSEAVRQSSPCFACVDLLTKRAGYAIDDICGDVCEVVSDLGPEILTTLERDKFCEDH